MGRGRGSTGAGRRKHRCVGAVCQDRGGGEREGGSIAALVLSVCRCMGRCLNDDDDDDEHDGEDDDDEHDDDGW